MSESQEFGSIYDLSKEQMRQRLVSNLKGSGASLVLLVLSGGLASWLLYLGFSPEEGQWIHGLLIVLGLVLVLVSFSTVFVAVWYAQDTRREMTLWRNRPMTQDV